MIDALSTKHELDPPYARTFYLRADAPSGAANRGAGWYWYRLDSYGDAVGHPRGPFVSRLEAQLDAAGSTK